MSKWSHFRLWLKLRGNTHSPRAPLLLGIMSFSQVPIWSKCDCFLWFLFFFQISSTTANIVDAQRTTSHTATGARILKKSAIKVSDDFKPILVEILINVLQLIYLLTLTTPWRLSRSFTGWLQLNSWWQIFTLISKEELQWILLGMITC